jgi:molybdopterin-guanine dinucleotide biosynthesis protein A
MVTAAILAGGRATRFGGRDKSALLVEGQTIFDRQLSELSQIAGEILVVGREMLHGRRDGVRTVADVMPDCGPLGGLHSALNAAHGDPVIVIACDMPYVSAPFLAYLAGLASGPRKPDDCIAVVPKTERGYHPLCAAYTRAVIKPIERRLMDGRLTMTDLLAELRLRVVAADEIARFGDPHRLLANVNTPAEHESLEALHNHEL